jgi:hypothetical protein
LNEPWARAETRQHGPLEGDPLSRRRVSSPAPRIKLSAELERAAAPRS